MRKMLNHSFLKVRFDLNCIPFIFIFHDFFFAVLKTKLVRARMDQSAKKVHISSTMHRTFGRAQWQTLRDLLQTWKNNLVFVQENMGKAIEAAEATN